MPDTLSTDSLELGSVDAARPALKRAILLGSGCGAVPEDICPLFNRFAEVVITKNGISKEGKSINTLGNSLHVSDLLSSMPNLHLGASASKSRISASHCITLSIDCQ